MTSFRTALVTVAAALAWSASPAVLAQPARVEVGLMLPANGTYASLGTATENGFRLFVDERGGRLGGRETEFVKVDDESDPAKATDNANKLVKRDNVDVLVGTVHPGVAMAMAKVARDAGTWLVVPNAGAGAGADGLIMPGHGSQPPHRPPSWTPPRTSSSA